MGVGRYYILFIYSQEPAAAAVDSTTWVIWVYLKSFPSAGPNIYSLHFNTNFLFKHFN
jgi:hypothetical protein